MRECLGFDNYLYTGVDGYRQIHDKCGIHSGDLVLRSMYANHLHNWNSHFVSNVYVYDSSDLFQNFECIAAKILYHMTGRNLPRVIYYKKQSQSYKLDENVSSYLKALLRPHFAKYNSHIRCMFPGLLPLSPWIPHSASCDGILPTYNDHIFISPSVDECKEENAQAPKPLRVQTPYPTPSHPLLESNSQSPPLPHLPDPSPPAPSKPSPEPKPPIAFLQPPSSAVKQSDATISNSSSENSPFWASSFDTRVWFIPLYYLLVMFSIFAMKRSKKSKRYVHANISLPE